MPRFGELLPTDVWAASARTLTAFAAQDLFDLPILDSGYAGVSITSGTVSGGFGSWAQISADIGTGKRLIMVVVSPDVGGTLDFEVEIGEGASGSEAAVARAAANCVVYSSAGKPPPIVFPLWRSLTNSARVSCRVRDNTTSAYGYRVQVLVV